MRLDPQQVQGLRAIVQAGVRLAAAWMLAWGAFQVGARLLWGTLGAKQLDQAWTVWTGVGDEHGIFRGLPALALGIVLALISRPLSRWIVRPPETSCPRCGHEAPGGPDRVCTECGLSGFKD